MNHKKSPPAATEGQAKLAQNACHHAATIARPTQAGASRALTHALALGMVKVPNTVRRHRRLCRAPHGEKCGLFCFVSIPATGVPCKRRYILAERRPVSARTGGLTVAGERRSAFFCAFKIPKHSRCSMHPSLFFRPASCGGRASLSSLFRKLARAGETAVLVTVLDTSARLCREMFHNFLTMQGGGHD